MIFKSRFKTVRAVLYFEWSQNNWEDGKREIETSINKGLEEILYTDWSDLKTDCIQTTDFMKRQAYAVFEIRLDDYCMELLSDIQKRANKIMSKYVKYFEVKTWRRE